MIYKENPWRPLKKKPITTFEKKPITTFEKIHNDFSKGSVTTVLFFARHLQQIYLWYILHTAGMPYPWCIVDHGEIRMPAVHVLCWGPLSLFPSCDAYYMISRLLTWAFWIESFRLRKIIIVVILFGDFFVRAGMRRLDLSILKKYRRHFGLKTASTSKEDLQVHCLLSVSICKLR